MNELTTRDDIPSTSTLSKLGVSAVGYTVAGIVLFLLKGIGIIIGAIACLIGIGSFLSKDPTDKKFGIIILTAGILAILSRLNIPFITGFSNTLLTISAVGLLLLGIVNGIRFFKGLKKRS